MVEHRNSQKRIYVEGFPYFITTVTYKRHPYFEYEFLAELLISDIRYAESLKQFVLHGYSILPDHVHLLFTPSANVNYSEVMRSLKTNFSRNANDIMFGRKDFHHSDDKNENPKEGDGWKPLKNTHEVCDIFLHVAFKGIKLKYHHVGGALKYFINGSSNNTEHITSSRFSNERIIYIRR